MRIAIITGASSGMGRDFTKVIATFDDVEELWIVARRKELLESLATDIKKPCRIIAVDLAAADSFTEMQNILSETNPEIVWLVNSAGYGLIGRFDDLSGKKQSGVVDINCTVLTKMTEICLPYMAKKSYIINMASASAFLPQPEFSVYAASKSYVLSFSRAIRSELRKKGINVLAVCPGPVDTEFFNTAETGETKMKSYKKMFMIKSERVVSGSVRAALRRKAVYVPSAKIKLLHLGTKILPHGLLIKIVYG